MTDTFTVSDVDFGRRDARHFFTSNEFDADDFSKSFLKPSGISIADFASGRRSFIYGIKGAGKSALLKYLDLIFQGEALTKTVYFTEESTERREDTVSSAEILTQENFRKFWIYFFMSALGRALENEPNAGSEFRGFLRACSMGQGFFQKVLKHSPTLERWVANFATSGQKLEVSGGFERLVGHENELVFLDECVSILKRFPPKKKIYVFVDEVEVSFSTSENFKTDVNAARQLILAVRSINESLRKAQVPVFFICALRKEVADRIYGEEIGKIMRDLGHEISWSRGTYMNNDEDYIHPLFEIVLRRIALSKDPKLPTLTQSRLIRTKNDFFPIEIGGNTQREILDLTTYRPRDLVVLFESAKVVDGSLDHFRPETFRINCRRNYRDLLWADFADALRSSYDREEIELFRKIMFQLPHEFYLNDFLNKLDDFSADPRVADILESDKDRWVMLLQELYELGAIGNFFVNEEGRDRFRFHNRGDTDGLYIAKGYKIIKCKGLQNV